LILFKPASSLDILNTGYLNVAKDKFRDLIDIPFAITRYEKRAIWTFFLLCLTESPKKWWGASIGLSTVLGSLGMAHWATFQALLGL
jgi:hypothetical protein